MINLKFASTLSASSSIFPSTFKFLETDFVFFFSFCVFVKFIRVRCGHRNCISSHLNFHNYTYKTLPHTPKVQVRRSHRVYTWRQCKDPCRHTKDNPCHLTPSRGSTPDLLHKLAWGSLWELHSSAWSSLLGCRGANGKEFL